MNIDEFVAQLKECVETYKQDTVDYIKTKEIPKNQAHEEWIEDFREYFCAVNNWRK